MIVDGLNGMDFTWGDEDTQLTKPNANQLARRIPLPELLIDKYDGTSTLGSFDPNGYNLFDLTGNIWGDSAIDNQDLADDAVTSEKIKDGEVMTEDLSDDAVTNDKNWRRFRAR